MIELRGRTEQVGPDFHFSQDLPGSKFPGRSTVYEPFDDTNDSTFPALAIIIILSRLLHIAPSFRKVWRSYSTMSGRANTLFSAGLGRGGRIAAWVVAFAGAVGR